MRFADRSALFAEFVRFNIVGISNTLLAFGVYSAVVSASKGHTIALVADYVFSITFSIVMNSRFTFRTGRRPGVWVILKMVSTYLFMFVVNWGMLYFLITLHYYDKYLSQALSTIVVALISYLMQKFLVFGRA
jgi:putative flippase GtrA